MQQDAAVVELLILSKKKSKRIRARENDLHTGGRKYVGEQSRSLDEILHKRHFIEKYIAEALCFQQSKVVVYACQCIPCRDLYESSL